MDIECINMELPSHAFQGTHRESISNFPEFFPDFP